jgi:multidrug efflux pump subunit AcrA (membrane-fusion protein)
MQTLLTLLIAVGGIATGIGAIWAAVVARRQAQLTEQSLTEQRQSLQEQTEIARRQAQMTEQSLAQTERSLAEQSESLREQNERTRLNLEVDLLFRMADRYDSQHFMSRRRSAAKHAIDNFLVDDDIVEVQSLNHAAFEVANFFDQVGYLQRLGALQAESVWNTFGIIARVYWTLYGAAIQMLREERKDPTIYENFERLNRQVADLYSEQGIEPLTRGDVRRILEDEAVIGEEPPSTTE